MSIQDSWEKALRKTEIIRPRVQPLHTYATTQLPYLCLSESKINSGDTVVRKGEVLVEKPSIILPQNMPQFEGFDFEEEMHFNEELLKSFFLMRGISFPSMKYNNKTASLDVYEGSLSKAIEHYKTFLQNNENVHTGLIMGPEDVWQFSVLIFVCSQASKSAESDIKRLFDDYERRGLMS